MKTAHLLCIALLATVSSAKVIQVPADQPTIQQAIDSAANGDIVQVSAGTYAENIDFKGKAITVAGVSGASKTIIDGGKITSVVSFTSGETTTSVLKGFTIRNGVATNTLQQGGGIWISNSSPTILNNIITQNHACGGSGIAISFGSAVVQNNTIEGNTQRNCQADGGAGISIVGGVTSPQIIGNKIMNNIQCCGNGGGIYISESTNPLIMNNFIFGNMTRGTGGGIDAGSQVDALVIQNLIASNHAAAGAGVYWSVPGGTRGPIFVNNTIHGNPLTQTCTLCQGSALYLSGFYSQVVLANNLFLATSKQSALFCDTSTGSGQPIVNSNDAWSPNGGPGFDGGCTGDNGTNGNITADAKIVDPQHNNYRLGAGSPAIDAGDNAAPSLPSKDIAGSPRIVNGNGGPTAIVDFGAYEFIP